MVALIAAQAANAAQIAASDPAAAQPDYGLGMINGLRIILGPVGIWKWPGRCEKDDRSRRGCPGNLPKTGHGLGMIGCG